MKKIFSLIFLLLILNGCGYNKIQEKDEFIKATWSDVLNQYQRRADLIPNLVSTVKGYAAHESSVFTEVTNARSKVGSVQISEKDINNPEKLDAYVKAQNQLSSSLSRLLLVAENYPALKANDNFKELQAQLEGTENRISISRNRFIQAVREYNTTIRKFPNNITAKLFSYKIHSTFDVENEKEIQKAPQVTF